MPPLTCLKSARKAGTYKWDRVHTWRAFWRIIMKRSSFVALLLLLPLCMPIWAQTDTLPDGLGKDIRSPEGLLRLIERKDPRFVIVDVRSPAEYAAGHIPTAINIPGGVVANIPAPPPKDRYIVVYCHGGMKAPAACEKMQADGYKYILVWGGILNWPYAREVPLK
jgi:rhodanese-related sulfurtransferase